MSPGNYEAEIAAFILAKGVTRCPTACAAPTHASGNATDRAALQRRAERLEALRAEEGPPGLAACHGRRIVLPTSCRTVPHGVCLDADQGAGGPEREKCQRSPVQRINPT